MTDYERHLPPHDPAYDKASRMLSLRVIIEGLAEAGIIWLGCASAGRQRMTHPNRSSR